MELIKQLLKKSFKKRNVCVCSLVGKGSYNWVGDKLHRGLGGKQEPHFYVLIQELLVSFGAVRRIRRRGRGRGQGHARGADLRDEAGQVSGVIVK